MMSRILLNMPGEAGIQGRSFFVTMFVDWRRHGARPRQAPQMMVGHYALSQCHESGRSSASPMAIEANETIVATGHLPARAKASPDGFGVI